MECVRQQLSNMVQAGPVGHLWLSTDLGPHFAFDVDDAWFSNQPHRVHGNRPLYPGRCRRRRSRLGYHAMMESASPSEA